jgi:virulence factor Mce-like protein
MRRVLAYGALLLVIAGFVFITGGFSSGPSDPTYKLEFDNAFGLVQDAQFKVAGVPAGKISAIALDQKNFHAVVTVQVTTKGFGAFRSDASCQSRPQSLIGEYFVDCQPGQYGKPLKSGATLPASHTFSTIPADLLADIMRLPQRERFTLIINELGAAVAARSEDIQTALKRAVPALDETDNLLNLLANDSQTLQQLTVNSDSVVTALANNSKLVQNFIVQADHAATDTATQQANLRTSLHRFPGLLEQLKPAMAKLGSAAQSNTPVLQNLNATSGQLKTLFTNLAPCSSPHTGNQCGFANASLPALQSLGQASVTGKTAVQAAAPTVSLLGKFAQPVPELAQNLSIVLADLDNRGRAVEPDSRSPGGQGFTGLEALLQYVFNQEQTINTFGPYGHMLAVDAFTSSMCSPYATPGTVAANLKQYGSSYRSCYSWLGPNQQGINEADPTNPGGCVPDPGGAPPGHTGPQTSAPACPAQLLSAAPPQQPALSTNKAAAKNTSSGAAGSSSSGSSGSGSGSGVQGAVQGALGQVTSGITTPTVSTPTVSTPTVSTPTVSTPTVTPPATSNGTSSGTPNAQQAQQLLNYLLSP